MLNLRKKSRLKNPFILQAQLSPNNTIKLILCFLKLALEILLKTLVKVRRQLLFKYQAFWMSSRLKDKKPTHILADIQRNEIFNLIIFPYLTFIETLSLFFKNKKFLHFIKIFIYIQKASDLVKGHFIRIIK